MNCNKVKYSSEQFANADIDRIKKFSIRSKIPIRAYLCKCGAWHLTGRIDYAKAIGESRESEKEKNLKIESLLIQLKELMEKNIRLEKMIKREEKLSVKLNEYGQTIARLRKQVEELIMKNIQSELRN